MKKVDTTMKKVVATSSVFVLDPFKGKDAVNNIAQVYQKAFGNKPWNEGYVCPICKTVFADEFSSWGYCQQCSHKDGRLVGIVRCWPIDKVITDFYREMTKSNALCLVMKDGGTIIAFAWGYSIQVNTFLDKYLEAPNLHSKLMSREFLYLDECAVTPKWQGQGCGKALLKSFVEKAKEEKKSVLLRTMENSVMHKLAEKFGGKVIQKISRQRVIITIII